MAHRVHEHRQGRMPGAQTTVLTLPPSSQAKVSVLGVLASENKQRENNIKTWPDRLRQMGVERHLKCSVFTEEMAGSSLHKSELILFWSVKQEGWRCHNSIFK